MSSVPHFQPLSVADYLAGKEFAKRKHEYVEGVVYAMAGGTNVHNRIAINGTIVLGAQLRGKSCQVFNSDTKVRARQTRGTRLYYLDITVACRLNPSQETFQDAPVVIVEVISDDEEHDDRV